MKNAYMDANLSPAQRAADLLSRMTLREKIGQLTQRLYGFRCYTRTADTVTISDEFYREVERFGGIGGIYGLFRADPWSEKDFETGLDAKLAIQIRNQMQEYAIRHSRFGIPILFSGEAAHGHQGLDGYMLPSYLAAACAFSPSLVERAYTIVGEQMHALGMDLALISVMDVLREPRWGRSEETSGEDPFHASEMARATVRGLHQGGIGVVAKHFCAQGETTGGINASAANIGERELWEIHLPPAKAAVEAGAEAVMATYNEIDGIYCCANRELLTNILRQTLGFSGVVMADALAINCLDALTGNTAKSAALSLSAGLDMGLLDDAIEQLEEAVAQNWIDISLLDAAVLRVLELKFARGLFEHPYIPPQTAPQHLESMHDPVAETLTKESIVLLKNNHNLLPLSLTDSTKLGITGPSANDVYAQMGDYTPPLREGACITPYEGIRSYLETHAPAKELVYAPFAMFEKSETAVAKALKQLQDCDTVIVALGGSSNRFHSRISASGQVIAQSAMDCGEGVDISSLRLPGNQLALLSALKNSGKRIIVILIGGRPYETEDIDNASDAFLCAFYPGLYGGKAIAELLFGEYAPAGRLPVSLPRRVGHLPVYYNHKRSYSAMKYADGDGTPAYPFGHGITYTTFAYKANEVAPLSHCISLDVTNTGTYAAHALPQLYLSRQTGVVTSRIRELCAYQKIYLLPNETKTVTLHIPDTAWSQFLPSRQMSAVAGRFRYEVREGSTVVASGEICFTEEEANQINRMKNQQKEPTP